MGGIAEIPASYRKLGSRNAMVTSDFICKLHHAYGRIFATHFIRSTRGEVDLIINGHSGSSLVAVEFISFIISATAVAGATDVRQTARQRIADRVSHPVV